MQFFNFENSIGIDVNKQTIDEAKRKGTHNEFYLCNAKDVGKHFSDYRFDCCVALDLIEHLSKKEGFRLIANMEKIATKKVIIFTPNGFLLQRSEDIDFQKHLSGWTVNEMRELGYNVIEFFGYKYFRGKRHRLKFRPKMLWGLISQLTHLYTHTHPEKVTALLCIKNIR